jgi:hypothetical protein
MVIMINYCLSLFVASLLFLRFIVGASGYTTNFLLWSSVASSGNGELQYFSASYGALFASVDSGSSAYLLQNVSMFQDWRTVVTDNTGQLVVAVQARSGLYISYDQGIAYRTTTNNSFVF